MMKWFHFYLQNNYNILRDVQDTLDMIHVRKLFNKNISAFWFVTSSKIRVNSFKRPEEI